MAWKEVKHLNKKEIDEQIAYFKRKNEIRNSSYYIKLLKDISKIIFALILNLCVWGTLIIWGRWVWKVL